MNSSLNNEKLSLMKTKINLDNLKSNYFLNKIFDHIQKNKWLGIIKYNKIIQKRLNINIYNYKDYSQLYTPIEVEIIPNNNGKFIHISKEEKEYYHIYFDDKKEEIKRNYLIENDKVNKIKIIIDYQVKSFKNLFFYCKNIESIHFKKFFRINITNMSYMFSECTSLIELNLESFNTINVTDMKGMFSGCSSLKQLNLSNFNTNNVIDMSYMFYKCSSLIDLNISNFIINNKTDLFCIFDECNDVLKKKVTKQNKNIKI